VYSQIVWRNYVLRNVDAQCHEPAYFMY